MWTLVIDGGSSNTRAVLVRGGEPAAVEQVPVGVRDSAVGGRREVVARAAAQAAAAVLKRLQLEPADVRRWCGCGMLTSNLGLQEVPHLVAPVGMQDLARGAVRVVCSAWPYPPLTLIPGVRTGPDEGNPFGEMMRGEECETFGLLAQMGLEPPAVCLLPGSHNKLVRIDRQGRIEAVWTSLAGEATRSLAEHTVLAGSMPPEGLPVEPDAHWLDRGVQLGRKGLLHAAFCVRAAQVLAGADANQCASLLIGAVVGSDVREMLEAGRIREADVVVVGGADPLRRLYAGELARRGVRAKAAPAQAAAWASATGAAGIIQLAEESSHGS